MFNVFFTNEISKKENLRSLFNQAIDTKPFTLEHYKSGVGIDGKSYLMYDQNAKVEGNVALLTSEQLWRLDQWMDIPLYRRISISVTLDEEAADLFIYLINENINCRQRKKQTVDINDSMKAFTDKQELNRMGLCDIHLIYPCSFDQYDSSKERNSGINKKLGNPYRIETPEELQTYEISEYFIDKLTENSNYEFNDTFITSIHRTSWGTIKCSFTYQDMEYEEYGFAYISRHTITEIGTFSIVFPCISNPVILQLFSLCENVLMVCDGEEKIEVTEWLKRKNIELYGYPKAIVFSYSQIEKKDILKCLAFELEPIDDICGKTLNDWADENIAQYNLAEVYASDRCLIEIRKDIEQDVMLRLKSQAVEIFFIEVLLFQEAAISRVCARVSHYLNYVFNNANCKDASEILFKLSKEMSNAIMFIDHKRLRYPSVRISSQKIAERFGLPEELERYYKYREILDEMIDLNSNEQDKVEGSLMNFLLLILTMIQVIPTLKAFVDVCVTGKITFADGLSLMISLSTCILLYLLYRLFKWRTMKKISKKRSERKKNYEK